MDITEHGLSVGIRRRDNRFFLRLDIVGKLTHEDYEVITPMLEQALDWLDWD